MKNKLILTVFFVLVFSGVHAEELFAKVTVIASRVPTTVDKKIFTTNVFDAGEVVPIDNVRFVSRKHTLWNGFVHISLVVDIDGYLISPPLITQTGVSDKNNMEDFNNYTQ